VPRLRSSTSHAVALLALSLSSGCWTAGYLAQQGVGQLRLMQSRRKIPEVLADPTVEPETKRRLKLAVSARNFGVEVLGLRKSDSYTRFVDTHGLALAWNVWAAPKDSLRPIRHKFAVAGAVPYLGFFREEDAKRVEARLRAQGYDTYVGEVSGYSTLGITSDPVFSSMLEGSPAHIVEVTLHEMLHGTLYLPGHSDWNESLATFVGLNGAALFFTMTGGGAHAAQQVFAEAEARRQRAEEFSRFLEPWLKELEALYASARPREEKVRERELVFARLQEAFRARFPAASVSGPGRHPSIFATGPINNALLSLQTTYHRAGPDHDRILAKLHGNLAAFIRLYKHAVQDTDAPIAFLAAYGHP
jgi:predicted aminopeptidase